MTIEELEALIATQEALTLERVILTVPKPKGRLRGRYVRTPFGNGEIASVLPELDRVVFWIEIKKIKAFIKKVRAEEAKR